MSRSRRHTPICGITLAESEKYDKAKAHRIERHRVKVYLATHATDEGLPDWRALTQVYLFAKDGKQRFDPERHPKLMRK
jgi:hypothetical protein